MGFYEHTLITRQDLTVDEVGKVREKYNSLINKSSGNVIKIEDWGLIKFSQRIKDNNKGFYIHYKFEGDSSTIDELKKNTLIDNSVLRHLTLKYKKLDTETEYFATNSKDEKKK